LPRLAEPFLAYFVNLVNQGKSGVALRFPPQTTIGSLRFYVFGIWATRPTGSSTMWVDMKGTA
jgi:hypothetical protein